MYQKTRGLLRGMTVVACAIALSGGVEAGEMVFPPASGHWVEVSGSSSHAVFKVVTNDICRQDDPAFGSPASFTSYQGWHTPLVLPGSPTSLTIVQVATSSNALSKGFSFTSTGAIFSTTGARTGAANVGTLLLASSGTALVHADLRTLDGTTGCVESYRVNW